MPWVTRSNHRYFYLSVRRPDGRIVTRYFGRGVAAEVAAKMVETKKSERGQLQERFATICDAAEEADRTTTELERLYHVLTYASLMSLGMHRPQNRKWMRWENGTRALQQAGA